MNLIDSIRTLSNLQKGNIPDLPEEVVERQAESTVNDIQRYLEENDLHPYAVCEICCMDEGETEQLREEVKNDPFQPFLQGEERRLQTEDYESLIIDVAPWNVETSRSPKDFEGALLLSHRLGELFDGEYKIVSIVDGAENEEKYFQIRDYLSGEWSFPIEYIDESEVKENPGSDEVEFSESVLSETGINVYEEGILSCRAAETVISRRFSEEYPRSLVIRMYPSHYSERFGKGSEWRERNIEERLTEELDADFYSAIHPLDRDSLDREARVINTAYRILRYEGEVESTEGRLAHNSSLLSNSGCTLFNDGSLDGFPPHRSGFLDLLSNGLAEMERDYDG